MGAEFTLPLKVRSVTKNYFFSSFNVATCVSIAPACFVFDKVSIGYCQSRRGGSSYWKNSQFGSSLTCLALCEIVDKKEDFTTYPGKDSRNSVAGGGFSGGVYVVPQEELVTTRFLIVNPSSTPAIADKFVRKAIDESKLDFLK